MENNLAQGEALKVENDGVLRVRYARLPVLSTALDLMVQIDSPVSLIPQTMTLKSGEAFKDNFEEILKEKLKLRWEQMILEHPMGSAASGYFKPIEKVELIECDLLTPKERK